MSCFCWRYTLQKVSVGVTMCLFVIEDVNAKIVNCHSAYANKTKKLN